ncbi:MAG: histidine phosphatase family protein [Fimbriimonas sp.]
MKVELLCVRHGESVRNLSCDYARTGDHTWLERHMREETEEEAWPLTEEGWRQAERTGAWIRARYGSEFDFAVTSPFVRAKQTAEGLGLGLTWREDARVREREWGDYCAVGVEPYTVDAYLQDIARSSVFDWRSPFPGGESLADVVPRVRPFLLELLAGMKDGDRAIVVSHGGTMRTMQMVLERLPDAEHARMRDFRMSNGCVITFRLDVSDADPTVWTGEARQDHPAFPAYPSTDWGPIGSTFLE